MQAAAPIAARPALAAAFLSGVLSVAGFEPFGFGPLAIIGLACLIYLWRSVDSPRFAAALGFAFGLGFFCTGVSWIYVSLHVFGAMPAALAALSTFAFCAYLALFPALVGSLQARLSLPEWLRSLLFIPALWTLSEWLRSWLLTGFPWLSLGYSQTDSPLSGFAPVAGVYGVSFLAASVAGSLVAAIVTRQRQRVQAVVAAGVMLGAGGALGQLDWTEPHGEPVDVALIQGNIPLSLKFDPKAYEKTLGIYKRLIESSLAHDDPAKLIVLPETAIPRYLDNVDPGYLAGLARDAGNRGADILIGVPMQQPGGGGFNSVVNIGASGSQYYAKSHLVPLGEFVPREFGWILSVLRIPLSDFSRGGLQRPITAGGQRTAVNICYEDAFGEEIILQLPEATMLVNVSNVAWFGKSLAPEQHLQISRMRAIETRRSMLRATNTGVTALIDRNGGVVARLPQYEEGIVRARAQGYSGETPYIRLGNTPVLVLSLAACVAAVLAAIRRRRSSIP
ncbi:MAG: apolipoprotein N-acyltransferase [Betaproteobacteria bacterium]|nr:apolipoprotein N-acyltransferase [Betaproteobacteria bacterium]